MSAHEVPSPGSPVEPGEPVDPVVRALVDRYLAALDEAAPGFAEGAYLSGSVALGDFRPGRSDVDLVVVSSAPAGEAVLRRLPEVHAIAQGVRPGTRWTRRRTPLDAAYLTWDQLRRPPADDARGPFSVDGRFVPSGHGPRNPVTWAILARHAIAVRGPDRPEVADDPADLARWTGRNLETYWAPRLERMTRLISLAGIGAMTRWECEWTALGLPRLHATLATGRVVSKTAAGAYALERFGPDCRRIVEEALRIRAGQWRSRYAHPALRRLDLLRFAAVVLPAARELAADDRGAATAGGPVDDVSEPPPSP